VHWNDGPDGAGFWALTRYRDVTAAYHDHNVFSSAGGAMLGGSFRSATDTASGRMLVASDPPRHRMLRQVMHQTFSPERQDEVRRQVRREVDEAFDRLLADGGGDVATDLTLALPAGALMGLLQIDRDAAHHLIQLTRQMIGYQDPLLVDAAADDRLRLAEIQTDIFEFFADLVRERRDRPGDDLVGILVRARVNGRPMHEEDILYNCMNMAVGGNETSSYTACAGILALMANPRQYEVLTGRPEALDSAVNEILRWASTNAYVQRIARRDTEIGGRRIRAGDVVTLWNVSANRDEEVFPDSASFDVLRTPNRHVSYGSGVHRCIGAPVAHTELSILFDRIARSGVLLAPAGEARPLRSNFILGTTRLPVKVVGS
jgi:cytochrome P450